MFTENYWLTMNLLYAGKNAQPVFGMLIKIMFLTIQQLPFLKVS